MSNFPASYFPLCYSIDMNIYTQNLLVCNSGQPTYVKVYLTFSLFFKIWLTELVLIPENSFSEELAPYWLLTIYVKGDIMAESGWWVSNIKISILLKKHWFSYVRVPLKGEEKHIFVVHLTLQSLKVFFEWL